MGLGLFIWGEAIGFVNALITMTKTNRSAWSVAVALIVAAGPFPPMQWGHRANDQTLPPVAVYVGQQVRDGFVDVDQGILDSIKDIQNQLVRDRTFRLAKTAADADFSLLVVSRGSGAASGAAVGYAVPGTGMTAILPVNIRIV